MNKKIFSIVILLILLFASSLLFLKGELVLNRSSQNSTFFYFNNTENKIPKTEINENYLNEILSFTIENNQKNQLLKISYYLNNEKISEENIEITQKTKKVISPKESTINEIKKKNDDFFVYGIKIDEKKDFELNKKVFLK